MTGAEKEAKRLYKLFSPLSIHAGKCALIAANEMEKRALTWADPSDHDTIKDYFKQLKKAIRELNPCRQMNEPR